MICNRTKLMFAMGTAAYLFSIASYAAYPTEGEVFHQPQYGLGFYVGAQTGWGAQSLDNDNRVDSTTGNIVNMRGSTARGWAGRIDMGFNVNQYFAVELGGAAWKDGDFRWTVQNNAGASTTGRAEQKTYDVDLLGKVTYPFNNDVKIFAKAGAAYVRANRDIDNSMSTLAPAVRSKANGTTSAYRPEAAVGFAYNVTRNCLVDLSYSYIWGSEDKALASDYIPTLHLATIGIQYNFNNTLKL